MIGITPSELRAIEIAADELTAYLDVVGEDGDLDQEIGVQKLVWAQRKLQSLIGRSVDRGITK